MGNSINDYTVGIPSEKSEVKIAEPISLIGVLAKKLADITRDMTPKDDIPEGMKLILQCLINKDGVTQLEIVRFTGFKAPTISILLHKMEEIGFVTRKPDQFDLRAMRVFITQMGRNTYYDAVAVVKSIENKVLNGLSDSEISSLVSSLRKISDNINEF